MHGDYQMPYGVTDVGHDSMEWEIVTVSPKNEGAGHWREWAENGGFGNTIGFGNAKFKRVGKCRHSTAEQALKAGYELDLPKEDFLLQAYADLTQHTERPTILFQNAVLLYES
jgi:hypothetical protein